MITNKSLTQQNRASEKGNVLFLILIAVALVAALSYAVTQSTRSGGGDASRETTIVNAAQITQYPASVKTAITRMIVSSSVDPDNLLFDPPSNFSALSTPTLQSYGVFYPGSISGGGGGATYTQAPATVMDTGAPGNWIYNGENEIQDIGVTVGGGSPSTASADIIAFLPDVNQTVCQSIHQKLGISTTIPTVTGIDYATEMAAATPNIGAGGGTITAAALDAQPQGCFIDGGVYVYYHVLVER
jgi:hypothetical protein